MSRVPPRAWSRSAPSRPPRQPAGPASPAFHGLVVGGVGFGKGSATCVLTSLARIAGQLAGGRYRDADTGTWALPAPADYPRPTGPADRDAEWKAHLTVTAAAAGCGRPEPGTTTTPSERNAMTTTTTTTTTATRTLADITLGDRVEHHSVEYHVYGLHRLTTRDHVQVALQVERITDGAESVISGPGDQPITVRSA